MTGGARARRPLAGLVVLLPAGLAACAGEASATWPSGVTRFEGRGAVGRERGLWRYYYPDGQIREEGRWRSGRRAGVWTQWFGNGQRASSGERRWVSERHASERHGPWTFWHENGYVRAEGRYDHGTRVGEWSTWRNDGTPWERASPAPDPDGG